MLARQNNRCLVLALEPGPLQHVPDVARLAAEAAGDLDLALTGAVKLDDGCAIFGRQPRMPDDGALLAQRGKDPVARKPMLLGELSRARTCAVRLTDRPHRACIQPARQPVRLRCTRRRPRAAGRVQECSHLSNALAIPRVFGVPPQDFDH